MSARERVILVDAEDMELGSAEKLSAHRAGALHRAFSVLVFNREGELLLQRRAASKYHSGGLWSNSCCGHPRPGEKTAAAARRRLGEELGFECDLTPLLRFRYRVDLGDGLVENEYDHVFVGRYDLDPDPDPEEVEAWRWEEIRRVHEEVGREPELYTYWFRVLLRELRGTGIGRSATADRP